MANGDVTEVKVLARIPLPGKGFSLAGEAKNNKVMVIGQITGTHVDTLGLKLGATQWGGPRALGLTTIDFIDFDVLTVNAASPADEAFWNAGYNHLLNGIVVVIDSQTTVTAGQVCVLKFMAVGDDLHAVEQV